MIRSGYGQCAFFLVLCFVHVDNIFLFFFKQKTAYELRISDWSSDVCSSDLQAAAPDTAKPSEFAGFRCPLRRRTPSSLPRGACKERPRGHFCEKIASTALQAGLRQCR